MTCTATRHGDRKAYDQVGCRCPQALADRAHYERLRGYDAQLGRPRRVDATGTRRRIQALCAAGWPMDEIGARIGVAGRDAVFLLTRRRWAYRSTAARVAAVYEQLADTPGPSKRSSTLARSRGWLPPLWWDDDTIDDPTFLPPVVETPRDDVDVDPVVVDRLVAGADLHGARVTRAERSAAYRRLVACGSSYAEIQQRLHVSGRTMSELAAATDAAGIEAAA